MSHTNNKYYIIIICIILCALPLSGCMFGDQDVNDFEILMTQSNSKPQSNDTNINSGNAGTNTGTTPEQPSNNNNSTGNKKPDDGKTPEQPPNDDNNTGNTGTDDGTPPELPSQTVNLNESVYTDMCQRLIKCGTTYKQTDTCVERYKAYVTTIPKCVDAVEEYYRCISGYACKTTGSCKDYVYQFNKQLPAQCSANNNYQQSSYSKCLDYLCSISHEEFTCDEKLHSYEKCVITNYGQYKQQEHPQIVENKIEEYDIAINCGCYNNHDNCAKVQSYIKDRAAAQSCFKTIKNQAQSYPACIYFEEAYYHCTAKGGFIPGNHSSRNQYVVDYYTATCKDINLDVYGYTNVDECVAGELKAAKDNNEFRCEEQQDAYDECMMRRYGILAELVSVKH